MTGKEVLLSAVRGEKTSRPAWLPYVGCHGGFLIDRSAREYLRSADLVVEGLCRARELYRPDGLPVLFDLQIEAEVLGCDLHWADDGPPSVRSHPLAGRADWDVADVPELDLSAGRIPMAMEATHRLRAAFGDEVALYGLIAGPFTLALHLLGNDIFLEMYDQEEKVRELVLRCAAIGRQMARAYLDAGCDVIAVVDPMTSQISPAHFGQFVAPALDELFDDIRAHGGLSCCFVCGDATKNLQAMCRTRCDNISVDEQIDMAGLREIARAHGKSFGGNLKLTLSLLLGSEADARRNAIECIELSGDTGFILAPGCDLPYQTPPVNVAAAGLMALDAYQRQAAAAVQEAAATDNFDDVILPDYACEPRVIVDVITLDSETCAPCQYMKDAADEAAASFGPDVTVREYKIKNREGIGMFCKLGAKNLPTICIDGEPTFVSVIPPIRDIASAIERKLARKRRHHEPAAE